MGSELLANYLIIYYDEDLNYIDGSGWCVEPSPGSTTYRYPSYEEAIYSLQTDIFYPKFLKKETTTLNNFSTCDVGPCNKLATECHGGEIYFCQQHYEGAAAAQRAGIPIEKAFVYKVEKI